MPKLNLHAALRLVVALAVLDVIGLIAFANHPTPVAAPPLETKVASGYGCFGSGDIPDGCIFGHFVMRGIVASAHQYEDPLLNYGNPATYHFSVADSDYLFGYGVQYAVYTPGIPSNHYIELWSTWIPGSGIAMCFAAPNGGRFCYFHIAINYLGGTAVSHTPLPGPAILGPRRLSGDELTAQQALAILASVRIRPQARIVPGGTKVGLSGWPTSTLYGNGSCCQQDAHLCVVYDAQALAWFDYVASGRDVAPKPKPKPLPIKLWGKRPFKDRHGHLLYQFRQWLPHARMLGAYLDHDRWHPKTKKNRHAYMDYHYRHGHLRCWRDFHRCKASKH